MNRMKKSVVAGALTAGLLGGGVAGAILGSGGVSGAQESSTTTVPAESEAPAKGERPDHSARLQETLAPLVEDGTITQEQADKVVERLLADRPVGRGPGGHGPGGHGGPGGPGGGWFGGEAAATALGISVDDLRTELRDGASIAQVAEEKGVAIDTVIAAIVAERTETIEAKVTAGDLTREEADEKLADLTERVTEQVNATRAERPDHRKGDAPGAPDGPGGPPEDAPERPDSGD